jgi:squalene-hopene/tetraprenyl-beta-curcumene cyclase
MEYWFCNSVLASGIVLISGASALLLVPNPARSQRIGELALIGAITALALTAVPNSPKIFLGWLSPDMSARPTILLTKFHIGRSMRQRAGQKSTALKSERSDILATPHPSQLRNILARVGSLLLAAYFATVSVISAWLVTGWLCLRKYAARAAPFSPVDDSVILSLCGTPWSGSRKVVILTSKAVQTPMAFGIFRPIILLPPSMESEDRNAIRAVLTHEISHITRGDTISRVFCALAGAWLFYNPFYWFLRRRIRLNQEYLADQKAAKAVNSRSAYAELMLGLVNSLGGQRRDFFSAASLIQRRSDFYIRMNRLIQTRSLDDENEACGKRWTGCAATAIALLMLPASCLRLETSQSARISSQPPKLAVAVVRAKALSLIGRGLLYLGNKQRSNGSWLGKYGPGVTALVVRCYIRVGLPESNPHFRRAMEFIEKTRHPDGGFYTNVEPDYNTAIVLRTLSMLTQHRYQDQARAGLLFLHRQMGRPRGLQRGRIRWRDKPSVFKAWLGTQQSMPDGQVGSSASGQIAAGMWMSTSGLDPAERNANLILAQYGRVTYSQLKSMIYAGLSPRDPRVIKLSRWITEHYTLSVNPAEGNSQGLYYYYVTFAKTLHATGRAWIVGPNGVRHDWRRDLVHALAERINTNGSWVNHGSKAWLEGNPEMATTYAVLALDNVLR